MPDRDVTREQLVLLHPEGPVDAPPFERLASGVLYRERRGASPDVLDAFRRELEATLGARPARREEPADVLPSLEDPEVVRRRDERRREWQERLRRDTERGR